jgi:hypothetical protein
MDVEELNEEIKNETSNLDSLKGFEIVAESLTYKIYDIFGRNSLLSMLYQVGAGPGSQIAERLKEKYGKERFALDEAFKILLKELKEFYSVEVRDIQEDEEKIRIEISNRCFLREPFKDREKLKFGKAFCRVNKGYFETAFNLMLDDTFEKIEINFLRNDKDEDACIEELIFYKKEPYNY